MYKVELIESRRSIAASPQVVFDAIAHPENLTEINPNIVNVEFVSEQRSGLGTRFSETRIMGKNEATTELEYTEFVPPEHVRFVADSGGAIWDTLMTVTPGEDGGSVLSMAMEDRPYKLSAKMIIPVMRKAIAKHLEEDMDRVKAFCEREG